MQGFSASTSANANLDEMAVVPEIHQNEPVRENIVVVIENDNVVSNNLEHDQDTESDGDNDYLQIDAEDSSLDEF